MTGLGRVLTAKARNVSKSPRWEKIWYHEAAYMVGGSLPTARAKTILICREHAPRTAEPVKLGNCPLRDRFECKRTTTYVAPAFHATYLFHNIYYANDVDLGFVRFDAGYLGPGTRGLTFPLP